MLKKGDLNRRICDVILGAENTETYREFMRNTEKEFNLERAPIDTFSDEELNEYLTIMESYW